MDAVTKFERRQTRLVSKKCYFCKAIEVADLKFSEIKDLVASGLYVNKKNSAGKTLLHREVCKKRPDIEVVNLLLEHGADVNILDKEGNTPLHLAVNYRTGNPSFQLKVVRILLDAGVDINVLNKAQRTAFSYVLRARKIHVHLLQELLERGVNFRLGIKRSPLLCLLSYKHLQYDAIKALLDHRVPINTDLLHYALKHPKCTSEIVEALLSQDSENNLLGFVDYSDNYGVVHPVCSTFRIKRFLLFSDSLRCNFCTPLHTAVRNEECPPSVIYVLLQHGADINAKCKLGYTPLMHAVIVQANEEVVEVLLRHGADPNQIEACMSAMHFAAASESFNPNILKILIKYGGNINRIEPSSGITPLVLVLKECHTLYKVKELLRLGATVPSSNNHLSPLRVLLETGYCSINSVPIIHELLKCKRDMLYEDILFYTVRTNKISLKAFKELIKHCVNIHHEDSSGQTLLQRSMHLFLEHDSSSLNFNFIIELLEQGAWYTWHTLPWQAVIYADFQNTWDKTFSKVFIKYATLQSEMYWVKKLSLSRYPDLINYQRDCKDEVYRMSTLSILEKHTDTMTFLPKLLAEKKDSPCISRFAGSILKILNDNMFPLYSDIIAAKLSKSLLIKCVMSRKIYTVSDIPYTHEVILTPDSIQLLGNYLSYHSLVNLIVAFKL